MSLTALSSVGMLAVVAWALGCGGAPPPDSDEPTTAKEKQRRDAEASGEIDHGSPKWGRWRYQGDRNDCFFVVGSRCFKTENSACQAAHCRRPRKCQTVGAGPATVSCK